MKLRRFLPLLLLVPLGCGLSDYERQMDLQRERIKLFDEEQRLLGDLIEQPMDKVKDKETGALTDQPVWPFDIFLRLPREVGAAVKGRYQGAGMTLPLFRYAGNDMSVYVAAGYVVPKSKEGIYKRGEYTAEDFLVGVRAALKDAYVKRYNVTLARQLQQQSVKDKRQPQSWRGEELAELEFDRIDGDDRENKNVEKTSTFQLYLHRAGNRQVAICYQAAEPLAKEKDTLDMIDLSLKSLDIGEQATTRRSEFGGGQPAADEPKAP